MNWEKSALLDLNSEEDVVEELAQQIGSGRKNWPIKYLGELLGGNPLKISFWEQIMTKFKEIGKLEEGIFVVRGEVNANCFGIERFGSVFHVSLWGTKWHSGGDGEDYDRDSHCHLVAWEQVCKPKDQRGF